MNKKCANGSTDAIFDLYPVLLYYALLITASSRPIQSSSISLATSSAVSVQEDDRSCSSPSSGSGDGDGVDDAALTTDTEGLVKASVPYAEACAMGVGTLWFTY